jgi:amino acid transporter
MSKAPRLGKPERNLVRAFTFVGAILGTGAIGLAKTAMLFAGEMGWLTHQPSLGPVWSWILGGAILGFIGGYVLVRARKRR